MLKFCFTIFSAFRALCNKRRTLYLYLSRKLPSQKSVRYFYMKNMFQTFYRNSLYFKVISENIFMRFFHIEKMMPIAKLNKVIFVGSTFALSWRNFGTLNDVNNFFKIFALGKEITKMWVQIIKKEGTNEIRISILYAADCAKNWVNKHPMFALLQFTRIIIQELLGNTDKFYFIISKFT